MASKSKAKSAGAPAWMVTFADMMSLLMALFVLMLSFSSMDVERYKLMAGNMREAFGINALRRLAGVVEVDGSVHRDELRDSNPTAVAIVRVPPPAVQSAPEEPTTVETPLAATPTVETKPVSDDRPVLERLAEALAEATQDPSVSVDQRDGRIVVSFPNSIAFPQGSDGLKGSVFPVLDQIIPVLRETDGQINIIGHTDSTPIATDRFRSNWDLSSARAVSVVHYLLDKSGIPAERLVAIGHADSRPLRPNDTPANRALNRRVEISVHAQ